VAYEPPAPETLRSSSRPDLSLTWAVDHEFAAGNIVVYTHTGDYVEPEGKEGLADLAGYLLARGGIKTKTAEELEERLAFWQRN